MAALGGWSRQLAAGIVDRVGGAVGIRLPGYFNLRTKVAYLTRGTDAPDLKRAMKSLVAPDDWVIDVGANVGLTARMFARRVGRRGRVFAVEPEALNYSYLCANTSRYPWVTTRMSAVGDSSGLRTLHLHPVSGTGNSFYGTPESNDCLVPCVTLDEFCEAENVTRLDLIKIDVEGAEVEVLRGLEVTLDRFPQLRLVIEFCPSNLERAGSSGGELLEWFRQRGFVCQALEGGGCGGRLTPDSDWTIHLKGRAYLNLFCRRVNRS